MRASTRTQAINPVFVVIPQSNLVAHFLRSLRADSLAGRVESGWRCHSRRPSYRARRRFQFTDFNSTRGQRRICDTRSNGRHICLRSSPQSPRNARRQAYPLFPSARRLRPLFRYPLPQLDFEDQDDVSRGSFGTESTRTATKIRIPWPVVRLNHAPNECGAEEIGERLGLGRCARWIGSKLLFDSERHVGRYYDGTDTVRRYF